jgi:hypothetical protein
MMLKPTWSVSPPPTNPCKKCEKTHRPQNNYGPIALIDAIRRALSLNAYGATYVENILYQEATPRRLTPVTAQTG